MNLSKISKLGIVLCVSVIGQQQSVAQVAGPTSIPNVCEASFSKSDFVTQSNATTTSPATRGARISRDGKRLADFILNKAPDGSPPPTGQLYRVSYVDLASGTFLSGFANDIKNPIVTKTVCFNKCTSPTEWSTILDSAKLAYFTLSVNKYGIIEELAPYVALGQNTEFFKLEMLLKNILHQAEKKLSELSPSKIDASIFKNGRLGAVATLNTFQGCKDLSIIGAVDFSNWRSLSLSSRDRSISFKESNSPYRSGTVRYSIAEQQKDYLNLQLEIFAVLEKIEAFHASNVDSPEYKNALLIKNAFLQGAVKTPGN